jgi:hypothetical protein
MPAYLGNPIAADNDRIVVSVNLTNVALTIAAQPDVPRNLTCDVTDTTPSITAGTITFVGKDPKGRTITEVMDLADSLTFVGEKIFASVTSATVAGATVLGGSGDETVIVGVGNVIGLPNDIKASSAITHVYLNQVRVAAPTIAAGVSESGVDASASTYANTKPLIVWYNVGG